MEKQKHFVLAVVLPVIPLQLSVKHIAAVVYGQVQLVEELQTNAQPTMTNTTVVIITTASGQTDRFLPVEFMIISHSRTRQIFSQ